MIEVKIALLILATISIVLSVICGINKDYVWSRHYTLIALILTMGV
jgi:uncharacterized membrane protein YuzA (DUF378 family)